MSNSPAVISVGLLLASLGLKLTDFVKYVVLYFNFDSTSDDSKKASRQQAINGVVTLLLTAVMGVVAVELLKHTAWADQIKVGKDDLTKLGFSSTVTFGVVFSAVAATLYDFKKAIDNKDDSSKPKLVGHNKAKQA